ncbi:MAG TPA: DivIVA domain-containing protein [Gemmatimonadaceae bacterium]|nr:DivIVA domain-containing protein [Gemmatimonadaceae bacterium]
MVDESFHLTPVDVRRYDFGSALRGYDKSRVDQFRDQVADELERMTRLVADLESKAKGFHEQLRAFRERDKALNDALVSAQQLRAEIREQSEREGQLIVREARAEAERLLDAARAEIRRLQSSIDALEQTRRAHIAQLRSIVQRQMTEIEAAEKTTPPASPDAAPKKKDGKPTNDDDARKLTPTWLDAAVPEK